VHASQTRKINLNAFTLVALIFTLLSLAISIFDNAEIKDVLGATLTAIFLILLPGYLLTEYIFKFNAPIKSLLVGSSLILSVIIPIHAALSKISSSFMLVILILLIDFILIIKMTKSKLFTVSFNF
jgi:hypothetical protein